MYLATLLFFSFFFTPRPKGHIPNSIYDFKVAALDGSTMDFSTFRGKKILIVNTATYCGNTPQYTGLQKLYEKYKDKLVVVGFPSNSFFFQEPGSNKAIADFCKQNYGVTFPMAAKVTVKGRKMAPIYQWLTDKKYNGYMDSKVTWNFQKYLVDEKGKLVEIFSPTTLPDSPEIIAFIEK
ncbi:MAG: glutathione peroxidase [Flavipsychrobacter sp.]|jgi:glutathione peroxidase|nr:glutathione peroxidase [Flavipsychrobacter sp.]